MLVNAKLRADPTLMAINRILSGSDAMGEIVEDGIYSCAHFNFGNYLARVDRNKFELDYPSFSDGDGDVYNDDTYTNAYGVCDSIEQLLNRVPLLRDGDRKFCVSFTEVRREDQPNMGGWRWHKWGPYIGTHDPQHEYLHDEKDIESVLIYHIYELAEGEYYAPTPKIAAPENVG